MGELDQFISERSRDLATEQAMLFRRAFDHVFSQRMVSHPLLYLMFLNI